MTKKTTKLIGLSIDALDDLLTAGEELHAQPARLIPFYKPGDEMAITSILLSALRLVDEFRSQVFRAVGLSRSKNIRFYTEADFSLFDHKRVDGLILVIKSNRIVDAILIEVKNRNTDLDPAQISSYLEIAKAYGIPKLLTISNQFVSFPTQSPLDIRVPKQVATYHLSWSYLLTVAHILLADNDNNIADIDQVEIMQEVLNYFESPNSGITGFNQMKPGWVEVSKKANAGTALRMKDVCVDETVSSWLQEERDLALILSRELGLFVRSGKAKYKNDLAARITSEKKELVDERKLTSTFAVAGAAAALDVSAIFDRKNIEMSATLYPPGDKKTRGQIGWLRGQLKKAEKKSPETFNSMVEDLQVEITIKFLREPIHVPISELEDAHGLVGNREIKAFRVIYQRHLGRKFESRKGVVQVVESMILDYYRGVLQHLKKWEKPAPQLKTKPELAEALA
ncbi:hypothetical protein JYT20_01045 [Rhodothermus sp. AH-315-K08]|nr:hypothetical protein [Rhodothermus sp. AH-315-K08]